MINLYSHGGSGNHGCEAIVRSTAKMIDQPIRLFSNHIDQDEQYGVSDVCELVNDVSFPIRRGSFDWLTSGLQTKLTGRIDLQIFARRKNLLSNVRQGDIFLSIGGDNYCYAGTEVLAALNRNMKKQGAKLVLWGCSIEPELVSRTDLAEDLSKFDLITARESISYEALKQVNPNTVLVSDPAFTLEKIEKELPQGWKEGNTIGINASPLIMDSADNTIIIMNAYRRLIETILKDTDSSIALIPHVVWKENNDLIPLGQLYQEYCSTGRVILLNDCNCMELKGYIARCKLFIGARTHATIAAYSSCVPTLVLGYSVKSRGIARDIFGIENGYVVSAKDMKTGDELVDAFEDLLMNEKQIKNHLSKVMPSYINHAYAGAEAVKERFFK